MPFDALLGDLKKNFTKVEFQVKRQHTYNQQTLKDFFFEAEDSVHDALLPTLGKQDLKKSW